MHQVASALHHLNILLCDPPQHLLVSRERILPGFPPNQVKGRAIISEGLIELRYVLDLLK